MPLKIDSRTDQYSRYITRKQGKEVLIACFQNMALGINPHWVLYKNVYGSASYCKTINGLKYEYVHWSSIAYENISKFLNQDEQPKSMANNRTLLSLCRTIKRNYKELIKNEDAYTWKWFAEKISDNYKHNYDVQQEKAARILFKLTNVEFVYHHKKEIYWPKHLSKSYYFDQNNIRYLSEKEFESEKNNGYISYDDVWKEWVSLDLFTKVYSNKVAYKEIAIIKTFHDNYHLCCLCQRHGTKNYVKQTEIRNEPLCNDCYEKLQKNKPIKLIDIITGYHSHKSSWNFIPQRKNKEDSIPMGVEIEVHNKTENNLTSARESAWAIYQKQLELNPKWHNIYFEEDGSLNEGGFEIVSNPMTLEYSKDYWPPMLKEMRKHCVGWNTAKYGCSSNYGIHITTHRNYWTDYQLARLIKFTDNIKNHWFTQGISQRSKSYRDPSSSVTNLKLKNRITLSLEDKKLKQSINRYCPVNVKETLVEIRIFNSTLNETSFLKNLEFVDAFNKWCKESGFSTDANNFIDWLLRNQWCHTRYSNLFSYLAKDKFPIKDTKDINNPVKDLFNNLDKKQLLLFNDLPIPMMEEHILNEDLALCA